MAEIADAVLTEQTQPEPNTITFYGQPRNMAMGAAMLGGGIAAFVAGLTTTFFAEAIAWTSGGNGLYATGEFNPAPLFYLVPQG